MAGQTDGGMCATKACQPMDYVLFEKLRSSHRVRTYSGAARKTRTYGESLGVQYRQMHSLPIMTDFRHNVLGNLIMVLSSFPNDSTDGASGDNWMRSH